MLGFLLGASELDCAGLAKARVEDPVRAFVDGFPERRVVLSRAQLSRVLLDTVKELLRDGRLLKHCLSHGKPAEAGRRRKV